VGIGLLLAEMIDLAAPGGYCGEVHHPRAGGAIGAQAAFIALTKGCNPSLVIRSLPLEGSPCPPRRPRRLDRCIQRQQLGLGGKQNEALRRGGSRHLPDNGRR
jgi:hypothetical protein